VPLLVAEPKSIAIQGLLWSDNNQTVWWGTRTECISALAKKNRQGVLTSLGEAQARVVLLRLSGSWSEDLPFDQQRALAEHLLDHHPLTAADAMQLAAAIAWRAQTAQVSNEFVCLDNQLSNAAKAEDFMVLP
jgi:predicted nucleic acid-binding protein